MNTHRQKTCILAIAVLCMSVSACIAQSQQAKGQQYSILEIRQRSPKPPSDPAPIAQPNVTAIDADEKINRLVTRLVLDAIPHTYTKDKDWGGQERRWDGIEFRRDNGRLETKRKWKLVNHGTWKKYSASLINPEQEFSVDVKNFHQATSGNLAFDIHFTSHIRFDARQSKWAKGVQLYSISADGHGHVRLVISCELDIDIDITQFPPNLIFTPEAKTADLIVDDFRIDRISKLGGEFAQRITRAARKVLDEEIQEKEVELVQKINAELAKHQDDFKLSTRDALKQKWTKDVQELLPAPIQKALESR